MKIIQIILSIIVVILGVISIVNGSSIKTITMSFMLIVLGIVQGVDAIYFYKQDKKIIAGIMLLISLFIVIITIVNFFTM